MKFAIKWYGRPRRSRRGMLLESLIGVSWGIQIGGNVAIENALHDFRISERLVRLLKPCSTWLSRDVLDSGCSGPANCFYFHFPLGPLPSSSLLKNSALSTVYAVLTWMLSWSKNSVTSCLFEHRTYAKAIWKLRSRQSLSFLQVPLSWCQWKREINKPFWTIWRVFYCIRWIYSDYREHICHHSSNGRLTATQWRAETDQENRCMGCQSALSKSSLSVTQNGVYM